MQVTPESSTDFDSQLITWGIAVSALCISLLSFGLASLSLWFQRRDKRPRLRISLQQGHIQFHDPDGYGGTIERPLPGFKILARNPTEKTIKIEYTVFVDSDKRRWILPKEWQRITEVPSHEKRQADISVIKFNEWVKTLKLSKPEKGYFLLSDQLENEYKTATLGKDIIVAAEELVKIKGINY